MQELKNAVKTAVKELFNIDVEPELTRPDEQFGDYATNVALKLASKTGENPRDIAAKLLDKLQSIEMVERAESAGPGFINFTLTNQALANQAWRATELPTPLDGKVIVAEYSDPNPFKVLHAGHLYTTLVGDAIASLLEHAGGQVHRVNFGGDVGLHVGKTMWAVIKKIGGENPEALNDVEQGSRLEWLSERYVVGNNAYEEDPAAKAEIMEMNKRVYQLHEQQDKSSAFAQIYWTTRQWSYEGFEALYERLGVSKFEKYYPESETTALGVQTVKESLEKGVLEKSEGAVVFRGEDKGLHTRVFLTSEGLPTYEAKDLGLALAKWNDYHFDQNVMITGNEIIEYMKVVLEVLRTFRPEIAERTTHLTHGHIKLAGGIKMSSRKGNILRAEDILDAAAKANKEILGKNDQRVEVGAVKYAFLKQRLGGDIIYDPKESVSLEGNSGPYIQYAHARARSILAKSGEPGQPGADFDQAERSLARKISEYPEVATQSITELLPHYISTYLYELAQKFNNFYEHNRVLGDERQAVRLALVGAYASVLKHGLNLLNIEAPERM
jgi:arginyl-tRNA synthetase